MARKRNRRSVCKICSALHVKRTPDSHQIMCDACESLSSICEICNGPMSLYSKKDCSLRKTCSQNCHNTRVSRMEHVRQIFSDNAKATYERQKSKSEYMERLRNAASQLHTFHKDDFAEKAGIRLLDERSTPDGKKKWEAGYYASRPEASKKIEIANHENWSNFDFRKKHTARLQASAHTPEANAKRASSVRLAYAEGRIVPLRGNSHIVLSRTNLERAIELPLYLSNVPYIRNMRVWRYYIDFAIPEVMIGIECDGKYWHDKNVEKDKKRDAYLSECGWTIIRLTEVEIKQDPLSALSIKVIPMIESALKNQIDVSAPE